jgi:PTH1 family peptidyl-tRNA hydrolase
VPLVLGLGNPGARYARTRHNVGWWVLDLLAGRWRAVPGESTDGYRSRVAVVGGREVHLVAPLTFMNLSGGALRTWMGRHPDEGPERLVVADDVYLPLGTLRLRARGSTGGHRGLASIEDALGGDAYERLRIGVGAAAEGAVLREHVLEEFDEDEQAVAEDAVRLAADAVECWLDAGILTAMNRFNRRVRQEESEP